MTLFLLCLEKRRKRRLHEGAGMLRRGSAWSSEVLGEPRSLGLVRLQDLGSTKYAWCGCPCNLMQFNTCPGFMKRGLLHVKKISIEDINEILINLGKSNACSCFSASSFPSPLIFYFVF